MPALTDNFMQVAVAGSETTMAAPGKAIGASSFNLTSPTGWPTTTGLVVGVRRVDGSGNYVAGTYTEWVATLSGSVLALNTTPLFGSDQTYAADGLTQVFIPLSASLWNKAMSTILNQHSQAGAHVGLTNSGGASFTGGITTDSLTVTGSNVGAGWSALGQTLTYLANNGQKEFTCTAPVDLTSTLSPGMRIQITRNTTPPTQCFAFASASSQYGTKSAPAGITFTTAFTCEAWIYVLSYGAAGIVGRSDNTTGGFILQMNASGQLMVTYAGSSTFTQWTTYQSLPLNRWIHVAGVVSSVASKTLGGLYINGISVPNSQTLSASTTLVQTSNLSVGAIGAGVASTFFNGYISEARVWSVAQSQSSIQSNMAISLTGSESNLVALFQGNGNFNDKTANANNLTATGGAIATQAANPYNSVEYAIVSSVSYSNPTTTVKLFAGTDYTIPNMTLNSAQYSLTKIPFGFPASKNKWLVDFISNNQQNIGTPAANVWNNFPGHQLQIPTGSWEGYYNGVSKITHAGSASLRGQATLSTANNTETDNTFTKGSTSVSTSTVEQDFQVMASGPIEVAALATYYLNGRTPIASTTGFYMAGNGIGDSSFVMRAVSSYL